MDGKGQGERRATWPRVFAGLSGSYLVLDAAEGGARPVRPMHTRTLAWDAIVIETAEPVLTGSAVALNVSGVGLINGRVSAAAPGGFVVEPRFESAEALQAFLTKLAWLKKFFGRQARNQRDGDRHRVAPRPVVWRGPSRDDRGDLYDISKSGAAILADRLPALGEAIIVGAVPAVVTRHFETGFAVRFATPFQGLADALAQLAGTPAADA